LKSKKSEANKILGRDDKAMPTNWGFAFLCHTDTNQPGHFESNAGLSNFVSLRLCVSAVKKFRLLLHNLDLVKLVDAAQIRIFPVP
jgi:hypothetical protein